MTITTTANTSTIPGCDQCSFEVTGEMMAAGLARVAASLNGVSSYERDCLEDASMAYDAGDLDAAWAAIGKGLEHASREDNTEDRPESWLLLAIYVLLTGKPVYFEGDAENEPQSLWKSIVTRLPWLQRVTEMMDSTH